MKYTVYGRPGCNPCQQCKNLLEAKQKDYTYVDLYELSPSEMKNLPGNFKSVPQVYLGDEAIGGLKELQAHLRNTA